MLALFYQAGIKLQVVAYIIESVGSISRDSTDTPYM